MNIIQLFLLLLPLSTASWFSRLSRTPSTRLPPAVSATCNKTSIDTGVVGGYRRHPDRFESVVDVYNAFKSCPNITSLDITIQSSGCSQWPDRYNFPIKAGDVLPPLETLRAKGYDFDDNSRQPYKTQLLRELEKFNVFQRFAHIFNFGRGDGYVAQRGLPMPPLAPAPNNLDLWCNATDWSRLRVLSLDNTTPAFLRVMPARLPALRDVTLVSTSLGGWDGASEICSIVENFLTALPNQLSRLSLRGGWNSTTLSQIVAAHGAGLETLDLLHGDTMLNASEISGIGAACPGLSSLTLDFERNGSWPVDVVNALSSIAPLHSLRLFTTLDSACQREWQGQREYFSSMEGNCTGEARFQTPFVDEGNVLELFMALRDGKAGEELVELTVCTGDCIEDDWIPPLYFPAWDEGRRAVVECKVLDEHGERKAEGVGWCSVLEGREYWKYGDGNVYDGYDEECTLEAPVYDGMY